MSIEVRQYKIVIIYRSISQTSYCTRLEECWKVCNCNFFVKVHVHVKCQYCTKDNSTTWFYVIGVSEEALFFHKIRFINRNSRCSMGLCFRVLDTKIFCLPRGSIRAILTCAAVVVESNL
jgi:hypothetical protein